MPLVQEGFLYSDGTGPTPEESNAVAQLLTTWRDVKLDFAIVGIAHSGTSSVVASLGKHPLVEFTSCATRGTTYPWAKSVRADHHDYFIHNHFQDLEKDLYNETSGEIMYEPVEDLFFWSVRGLPSENQVRIYNGGESDERPDFPTPITGFIPGEKWLPATNGSMRGLKQVYLYDVPEHLAKVAAVKENMKVIISVRDPLELFEWYLRDFVLGVVTRITPRGDELEHGPVHHNLAKSAEGHITGSVVLQDDFYDALVADRKMACEDPKRQEEIKRWTTHFTNYTTPILMFHVKFSCFTNNSSWINY